MKLVEIGKDYNDYVNLDFLVRLYKRGCDYYCELTSGITYRITEETYRMILEYDKKTS